jgi:hypothetical protein
LNDTESVPDGKKYPILEAAAGRKLGGVKCEIASGAISPTKHAVAVCAMSKKMFGLKTIYFGFVFSPGTEEIVGRVAQGRRLKDGWVATT